MAREALLVYAEIFPIFCYFFKPLSLESNTVILYSDYIMCCHAYIHTVLVLSINTKIKILLPQDKNMHKF